MYEVGRGVPKDDAEAARWYRLAADQVQTAPREVEALRLDAKQGDAEAQYQLGTVYLDGLGVEMDPSEALSWLQLSADQGHGQAQSNLTYLTGHETAINATPDVLRALADESVSVAIVPLDASGTLAAPDVAFSPDGTRIATSINAKTWLWPADGSGEPVRLWGSIQGSGSAAFSPDGTRIVTTGHDGVARVFLTNGTSKPVLLVHISPEGSQQGRRVGVKMAAFSPDGSRIVTVAADHARVWQADGLGEPVVLTADDASSPDSVVASSPDGTRVVTTHRAIPDRILRVWGVDGTSQSVIKTGLRGMFNSVAFSPDGARIVATALGGTSAEVWWADGAEEPLVLGGHTDRVNGAVFSPDGARMVTVSNDGTARVWQADGTGPPVVLTGHSDWVTAAAFSPDSTRIVTASGDGTARVWQADGSREPIVLDAGSARLSGAAFSPDGTRIVTASHDGTAQVWHWPLVQSPN